MLRSWTNVHTHYGRRDLLGFPFHLFCLSVLCAYSLSDDLPDRARIYVELKRSRTWSIRNGKFVGVVFTAPIHTLWWLMHTSHLIGSSPIVVLRSLTHVHTHYGRCDKPGSPFYIFCLSILCFEGFDSCPHSQWWMWSTRDSVVPLLFARTFLRVALATSDCVARIIDGELKRSSVRANTK